MFCLREHRKSTLLFYHFPRSKSVHPRERGEHAESSILGITLDGSSPRARGTPVNDQRMVDVFRFIPASAGNTLRPGSNVYYLPVHPRERGEHCGPSNSIYGQVGSSPRARGTRNNGFEGAIHHRFIPASAGNTTPFACLSFLPSVHPRERGEHKLEPLMPRIDFGSSPRARGTHVDYSADDTFDRFIPASAGNTHASAYCRGASAVHPRERGEHFYLDGEGQFTGGSSPRARGTRLLDPAR